MTPPLHILFEDNHCLAVAKPAPLLTQAPPGVPSLEEMAKAYLQERCNKTGNIYLGVPHRLDRPVSGVVLFARTTKSAQRLSEQFQHRSVTKIYWAVIEGIPVPGAGIGESWMRKVADAARAEPAEPEAAGAQRAVTHYRTLQPCDGGTLIELRPETGRMHQLRLQASQHGWPVRGDQLYGSQMPFGPPAELPRDRIIALHARALTFLHPIRYEPVSLEAPLPAAWQPLGIERA
jgi:23S rRNA pseudouridine1911/1915/1917 synthase